MGSPLTNTDYRMLAVDLDGTLLGREGIAPADILALHQAHEAGIEVVVATGRSWVESEEALKRIGLPGVMVAAGGAMLHDVQTGETLDRFTVEHDVIHAIARPLLSDGHVVHLLQDHHKAGFDYWMVGMGEVDAATKWWLEEHPLTVRYVATMEEVDGLDHTVRVGTVGASAGLAQRAEELSMKLGNRAALQHWAAVVESEVTGSTTHLLEAFHPYVDKWTMLKRILETRDIKPEQVVAVGDGLNDIGMLCGAGVGFAIDGSLPNVIAAADDVTGSLGSGVAHVVKNLLVASAGKTTL